jgi:Rod binding domain-containing protein
MDASLLQFNAADPSAWQERMTSGSAPEVDRLAAASQEFEAVLLRQFLSEAFKPITENGDLFGSKNPVYGYMITDSLANGLSSADVFGFSNVLQAQLAGAIHNNDENDAKVF